MPQLSAPLPTAEFIAHRARVPVRRRAPCACPLCGRLTRSKGAVCGPCCRANPWGVCLACGRATTGPRFCPEHVPAELWCPRCGRLMRRRADLCFNCGVELGLVRREPNTSDPLRHVRGPQPPPPARGTPCADCGRPAREHHHPDPRKPPVVPLCHSCHMRRHGRRPHQPWAAGTLHHHYIILSAGHGMRFALTHGRRAADGYRRTSQEAQDVR